MRERRLAVGSLELAVAEAGEGGRPLLLVHGFGGAKEDFTDFLDDLAALGWHAVSPDLRGHGGSDQPAGEEHYDFGLFVDDLVALFAALGWERAVVLGHSMGGMIVQHLVLDHPEMVEALVLMDTSHAAPDGVDPDLVAMAVQILRDDGLETFLEVSKAVEDPLASPAYQRVLRERPGYEAFCDAKARAASADMRIAMFPKFLSQPDRLEALSSVRVPTLVLVGEQDAAFVAHAQRMAKAVPGARLVEIAGAGHSPQFEGTDQWWATLTDFLGGL